MRLVIPEVKKQETVSIDTSSITSEYVIQCSTILPDVKREGRVIDYTDKNQINNNDKLAISKEGIRINTIHNLSSSKNSDGLYEIDISNRDLMSIN